MKKILCIVLSLIILASTCCAQTADDAARDLAKYGIMSGFPDGTFRLEDNVTRAQIVKMIVTALKKDDFGGAGIVFPDVSKNHWAKDFIECSVFEGIVNGFPDGTFRPEDSVTKFQAIKMVICMIGHDRLHDDTPKYPTEYINDAIDIGLVSADEVGKQDAPASRGFVARLISKALDIPITEAIGFGTGLAVGNPYVLMNGLYGRELKTIRMELEK